MRFCFDTKSKLNSFIYNRLIIGSKRWSFGGVSGGPIRGGEMLAQR